MNRVAIIGDLHGCIDELIQLYDALSYFSLDEIRIAGDFVDRGPDSGAAVRFCREKGLQGIYGNHEDSVLSMRKNLFKASKKPRNPDKLRSNHQLSDEDAAWLSDLPKLHHYENLNLVVVHGGLWPKLELWQQPHNIIRAQMIHPGYVGQSRWWGPDATKKGYTEEDSRAAGFERWHRIYDGPWNVVYGHSVYAQPFIHQNPGAGMTIGIDTGSCFGGSLTAMVWDSKQTPFFVSVKAKKHYADVNRFTLGER